MPSPVHTFRNHGTSTLAAALAALNDALQGPRGPTRARPDPEAQLPAVAGTDLHDRAACTMRAVVEAGTRRMTTAPWRICRAVYPDLPAVWPVEGKDAVAVMADCHRSIAAERERASHWSFDFNRLIALRQAERALERLLRRAADDERLKAASGSPQASRHGGGEGVKGRLRTMGDDP